MRTLQPDNSGERVLIEHSRNSSEDYVIYLMHAATYRFAENFSRDKHVLDYGCGSGYGSAALASIASTVDGVDIAADAVAQARAHYSRANLHFHHIGEMAPLPFPNSFFDVVLSFQVIEHVNDVDHYLAEIRRVLTPSGALLLATPDRSARLFPWQRPWNRWHVNEYSSTSLASTLLRFFSQVEILHMSGRRDIIQAELRRYRKLKWCTIPFTLPFMPRGFRILLLNMLHILKRKCKGSEAAPANADETAIYIGPNLRPSVNLVVVARLRPDDAHELQP